MSFFCKTQQHVEILKEQLPRQQHTCLLEIASQPNTNSKWQILFQLNANDSTYQNWIVPNTKNDPEQAQNDRRFINFMPEKPSEILIFLVNGEVQKGLLDIRHNNHLTQPKPQ